MTLSQPYKYKFTDGRPIHITGIDPGDIDDCFKVIQDQFSIDWLSKRGGNIIQYLWNEPFHLATVELYSLGFALRALLRVDPKFVAAKVKEIMGNDINTTNGALFEIFGLSYFAHFNKIEPAKGGNPGYDGTIFLPKERSVKLSIKNYAISQHHKTFLKEAAAMETQLKDLLKKYNTPPIEFIISKKTAYPSAQEWNDLRINLEGIFANMPELGSKLATGSIEDWGIIVRQIQPTDGKFSKNPKSYTLIISSPFHKNEEKNLHDKLEEGCANLVQHANVETPTIKNGIIIHLPRIANRKSCQQWAENYLRDYPDKPISAILLYQPLVMTDEKMNVTYISNGVSIIPRQSIIHEWEDTPINIGFPMGKTESGFGEHTIYIQDKPDSAIKISLKNSYIYQRGNHYYEAERTFAGLTGNVAKVASGITRHSVFTIFGQSISLSPRIEPVDELQIM